jgi:hypothetical protein
MFASFLYSEKSKNYGGLASAISGLFALFCIGGLASGLVYYTWYSVYESIPKYIVTLMYPFYALLSLFFFTVSSTYISEQNFKGGFWPKLRY